MVFMDMVFAAVIGLILTMIFVLGFRKKGPWSSALAFFMVVFLSAWAVGRIARPVGPSLLGVYWLPYFGAALVIALLLAAIMPIRLYHHRKEIVEQGTPEPGTFDKVFDGFFWGFMVVLVLMIVLGYVAHFTRG